MNWNIKLSFLIPKLNDAGRDEFIFSQNGFFIEKTFQEFYFPNFKFLNICPEVVPALSSMASNEVIDKYQPQKHFFSSPKIEKSPKRCQNEITSISFVGK